MHDARETATEDQPTAIDSALRQGAINNEIKWIRALYEILGERRPDRRDLPALTFKHLQALSACLLEHVRSRLLPPQTAADASRLRAACDRLWEFDAAFDEGLQRGSEAATNIYLIRRLQETFNLPPTDEEELRSLTFKDLQAVKDGVLRIARERVSCQAKTADEASAKERTD